MTASYTRTLAELQQLASAGDAQAQFELARYYSDGAKTENDADLGLEWLNKAAEHGHADAQFALGFYYFLGSGDEFSELLNRTIGILNKNVSFILNKVEIEPAQEIATRLRYKQGYLNGNIESAFSWFQKAAAQDHVKANSWLGQCYRDGIGTEQNDEMAFNCFRFAAEHGWAEAQYDLARCYFEGKGVPQHSAQGMQWCEKAAKNGFAEAQYLLACRYLDGDDEMQNVQQGLAWLNKTAQNDDSVIEARMMKLADLYAHATDVKQTDTLALQWLEKVADTACNDFSPGEAFYQAAKIYFDGNGSSTNYKKGMEYLRDAINCNHAGAKQWLENAYLQFTFPEFIGRSDAEQCYQYAYNWLSNAFEENPLDQEVNFALGVLLAFGKGTIQNDARAFEYFYKFHSGDGIDNLNIDYPDELDYLADVFCAIYKNWHNGFLYPDEDSGKYFTSKFQASKKREGNYIVLPSLIMDFYFEKREFDLLRSYIELIENTKNVFEQQSTQKQFTKIIFKVTQQEEKLQGEIQQNELLQIKMQKLVEQFTHTLGNVIFPDTIYQVAERLKTNPECRKDVLLLNEAYHSEIIIKLQSELLRQRYANNNPEKFRQLIRLCRRTPDSADKTKSIADILDYAASRVTARFLNQHNASLGSIRDKILSCKNVSLEALKQGFEDDILLNRSLNAVEWINQNLRPFKVVEISRLWQKVCILAESHAEALLFGYFSEALFNAFKYADHASDDFLTVVFDEKIIDGKAYLTCSWQNPLGSKAPNSLGTGKGLDAIQEDLMQLNDTKSAANSLLITQENKKFQVTIFFIKDLLINDIPILKIKRKVKME